MTSLAAGGVSVADAEAKCPDYRVVCREGTSFCTAGARSRLTPSSRLKRHMDQQIAEEAGGRGSSR